MGYLEWKPLKEGTPPPEEAFRLIAVALDRLEAERTRLRTAIAMHVCQGYDDLHAENQRLREALAEFFKDDSAIQELIAAAKECIPVDSEYDNRDERRLRTALKAVEEEQ